MDVSGTEPGYSKCGLRISSLSITWELGRNPESQMHSRLTDSDSAFIVPRFPGDARAYSCLRSAAEKVFFILAT